MSCRHSCHSPSGTVGNMLKRLTYIQAIFSQSFSGFFNLMVLNWLTTALYQWIVSQFKLWVCQISVQHWYFGDLCGLWVISAINPNSRLFIWTKTLTLYFNQGQLAAFTHFGCLFFPSSIFSLFINCSSLILQSVLKQQHSKVVASFWLSSLFKLWSSLDKVEFIYAPHIRDWSLSFYSVYYSVSPVTFKM